MYWSCVSTTTAGQTNASNKKKKISTDENHHLIPLMSILLLKDSKMLNPKLCLFDRKTIRTLCLDRFVARPKGLIQPSGRKRKDTIGNSQIILPKRLQPTHSKRTNHFNIRISVDIQSLPYDLFITGTTSDYLKDQHDRSPNLWYRKRTKYFSLHFVPSNVCSLLFLLLLLLLLSLLLSLLLIVSAP